MLAPVRFSIPRHIHNQFLKRSISKTRVQCTHFCVAPLPVLLRHEIYNVWWIQIYLNANQILDILRYNLNISPLRNTSCFPSYTYDY